jgi:outer membrane protein assembly factor BamA
MIRAFQKAILELYAEEGFPNATVEIRKLPIPGDPRAVHLTFVIKEGPRNKKETLNVRPGARADASDVIARMYAE